MSELADHVGFWMRAVSNAVSHSFADRLEATGVTVAEWVVLREMYGSEESTSPSAVAESTGLTRGAISKLVDRLLQKKLVTRAEATDDRRFQEIRLSAAALSLVPRLAEIADENDEDFFGVLTSAERAQLTALLRKLARSHDLRRAPTE
ncbi:MAG TPA: MarR family transcriptional regulator [Polyangiaceae bacterium]